MKKEVDISKIVSLIRENNFSVEIHDSVIRLSKNFTPGDLDQYCECEHQVNHILYLIPRSAPGSIWGTDGGSVGGHYGLTHGIMEMHKSGCNKLILKKISKLL